MRNNSKTRKAWRRKRAEMRADLYKKAYEKYWAAYMDEQSLLSDDAFLSGSETMSSSEIWEQEQDGAQLEIEFETRHKPGSDIVHPYFIAAL